MKLIFDKDANNEITVRMTIGTIVEEFSYTKMIKSLLKNSKFEEPKYTGVSAEEKVRIGGMLKKISEAIDDEEE